MVSGRGPAIVFNLSRSDGFESPPGKDLILKDFLKSEADMNFKPTYMIVDELPDVPDEDDEAEGQGESNDATPSDQSVANSTETAKVPPLQPPVMPNQVTPEASPSFQQQAGDNVTRRDALQHQFDQLQSKFAAACAAHPDERSDLEDLVSEFRLALREFDLAVASEWLQKLTEVPG